MTKRKIDNTTIIIDLDPSISEVSNLRTYSRKRSANSQAQRKKITKQDYEEKFLWFLHIPCRKRSNRKLSHKNADHDAGAVSKQDKKLDSLALISHKNADHDADAVSKRDKKLGSQALISHKNADHDADAVSKRDKKLVSRALISHKNADHDADAVSKRDKKLDSRALISHKNADHDADAVSKRDKKLVSQALISHKNADHDADAVSKRDTKLDSRALISHKNADHDADAVSKRDKKLYSRALIRHKDADNADGVSKRTKKLDSGTFECYLENLWRSFSEDQRTSCTYLDCLWFTLYKKAPQRSKVLSWINKKHIFSKKYVFIPIVCWSHWSLLILCHFGESLQSETRTTCMLLLDSLEGADPRRLEPDIRKFIFDIYKAEGRPETKDQIRKIPLLVPKVPQQRDGEECGSFVLYFINLFMEGAPEDFSMKDYPYFMKKSWFTREGLECFLKRLDSFPK